MLVGGGGSQRLLSLNPTTVLVVLLLGLWLLLGCDNILQRNFGLLYIFGQPFPNISLILGHYVRNLKKTHSTPKDVRSSVR